MGVKNKTGDKRTYAEQKLRRDVFHQDGIFCADVVFQQDNICSTEFFFRTDDTFGRQDVISCTEDIHRHDFNFQMDVIPLQNAVSRRSYLYDGCYFPVPC